MEMTIDQKLPVKKSNIVNTRVLCVFVLLEKVLHTASIRCQLVRPTTV